MTDSLLHFRLQKSVKIAAQDSAAENLRNALQIVDGLKHLCQTLDATISAEHLLVYVTGLDARISKAVAQLELAK